MIARAAASPVSTPFRWPLQSLLGDLRVQYGTKVGLAGLLAFYCALVLRLEHPNWSVLTVLVMMNSQYVGSITVKVILRVLGTIGGAVLGIWVVGSDASTPVVLLTIVFCVMAFATYKFGQFPASQTPYFHFLIGLTLLTVATYGVDAPDQIWLTGLHRMLETMAGALSALLVTSILWPRYAREEFFEAGRAAMQTAGNLLSIETDAYIHGGQMPGKVEELRATFAQQLATLRNLLQAGARESTVFRAGLSNYNAFLVSLTDLFQSALDLQRRRQDESPILEKLREDLEAVGAAISEEFVILTLPRRPHEKLPDSRLKATFALLEEKVNALRGGQERLFMALPLETVTAFLGHYSALHAVCDDLDKIRSATEELPRFGQIQPKPKVKWNFRPTIDWFWVKCGIKGGLASVIALFLLRWINPPGSASIPLAAWVFVILSRPFVRAGGQGDLRIFQRMLFAYLLFIPTVALLQLTTPFLADYAVMNLTLFALLFAFGFFTARIPGSTFWSQVAILAISVFVGLNQQVPVPSLTIIESFLGLATGMAIAAIVGRLIWPVLPQILLRDDLVSFFRQLKALLNREPHPERIRTQLAILPVEAQQAARRIRIVGYSAEEQAKITRLLRGLPAMVMQSAALVVELSDLPEIIRSALHPQFERLEAEFKGMLDTFVACLHRHQCRRPFPTLQDALTGLNEGLEGMRKSGILPGQQLDVVMRTLEVANRYQSLAEALEECSGIIQTLRLDQYMGDYSL